MKKFITPNYNEVKVSKVNQFETEFTLSPLERGFGNTIGNAIRRILLSSVPGVAPFGLKIKGISHEFQTIKDVEEDVVRLILNIKKLRFIHKPGSIEENDFLTVKAVSKNGELRAKDLDLPPLLEVVDKELLIATTSKDKALEFELFVKSGRGFITFEENKDFIKDHITELNSEISSGEVIAIDSEFSPIVNVAYKVEELNSSSPTIEEKLTISIKTDGSIEAKDAIALASDILSSHLAIIADIANLDKKEIFSQEEARKEANSIQAQRPISELNLSVRSYNCLKREGIETIAQLAVMPKIEIQSIPNLGAKSLEEIMEKLEEYRINFMGEGGE